MLTEKRDAAGVRLKRILKTLFLLSAAVPLTAFSEETPVPDWQKGAKINEALTFDVREKRCLPISLAAIQKKRPVLIFTNQKEFPAISRKDACPAKVACAVIDRISSKVVPTTLKPDGTREFGKPVTREVIRCRIESLSDSLREK